MSQKQEAHSTNSVPQLAPMENELEAREIWVIVLLKTFFRGETMKKPFGQSKAKKYLLQRKSQAWDFFHLQIRRKGMQQCSIVCPHWGQCEWRPLTFSCWSTATFLRGALFLLLKSFSNIFCYIIFTSIIFQSAHTRNESLALLDDAERGGLEVGSLIRYLLPQCWERR